MKGNERMIAPETLLQNRYLVIKQIGQGGMGAVYLANDQRFGNTVALKETFFTDATLRKAFEREARLLNRLRHPALPNVSDHFVEDEGQFLVMEFIAGEDLSEMLKAQGGAFPVKEVLGWADQLLDALDYLHTQEMPVIHRDIKPQNLKLTPRGQIILLDFGLAKGTPLQMSQITASGSVFGYSRNYAPIEQIQGTGTDLRSDLYSLAATLYHLITGVTPPDALTRAADVLNGQPDPLQPANDVRGQITPAVAQVLMRAMSQNAGLRPQTATAMREELREAGKQTLVAGHVTNAQAVAVGTLLEQDTQLISTDQPGSKSNAEAGNVGAESVAPVVGSTNVDAALATKVDTPTPVTTSEEQVSIVTRVEEPSPARSSLSGRRVGIAAGAIVLVLIGVVVFAVMRREPVPSTAPAEVTNPAANNSQTEPPIVSQNNNAGSTVPPDSNGGATQKSESPAKRSKGSGTPVPPNDTATTVPTPPEPRNPNPGTEPRNTGNDRDRDYGNLTPAQIEEQKRNARMMRRRAAGERQRAQRERRRAETMRRRQIYGQP